MTNVTSKADAATIQEFFKPHKAIAVNIGDDGEADVAFASHEDAEEAMERHGQKLMSHRVKLKLTSCKPKRVEKSGGRSESRRDRGEKSERSESRGEKRSERTERSERGEKSERTDERRDRGDRDDRRERDSDREPRRRRD